MYGILILTMDGKPISHLISKGALTEICGPAGGGKTELTLQLIRELDSEKASPKVCWIERDFTIYPPAFARHGIDPNRIFWVDSQAAAGGESDSAKLALWSAQQALASRLFGIVVVGGSSRGYETVALRRLQLAAEKSQAFVLLLSEYPTAGITWPIRTQLQVDRGFGKEGHELRITVLKGRGKGDTAECQLHLG